ncbi:MAG: hypothetical protein JSW05_00550 [Candidatus Thorarchaeota archaeon]|nr:MAG: hypothetical protein JSW05_00550 [Candidatus Thorarchaeota archaeon]
MSEAIRGNIDVDIDHAWYGCLFFTSDRLIVARTEYKRYYRSVGDTDLLMDFNARRRELELREEGEERERMYMTTRPDDILAADKRNFAMPYSDIVKVEMKKPGRVWAGKITITTTTREKPYKYPLREGKKMFDQHVNLVRSLLPNRLSIS